MNDYYFVKLKSEEGVYGRILQVLGLTSYVTILKLYNVFSHCDQLKLCFVMFYNMTGVSPEFEQLCEQSSLQSTASIRSNITRQRDISLVFVFSPIVVQLPEWRLPNNEEKKAPSTLLCISFFVRSEFLSSSDHTA